MNRPTKIKSKPKRLSRESWFQAALDIMQEEGSDSITIYTIAKFLNITKGSFYWHFENFESFIFQLFEYWTEIYTKEIRRSVESQNATPQEKLERLMFSLRDELPNNYDLAMRSLANRFPDMKAVINNVDEFRYNYVESIFKDIGYDGKELKMRVSTFVVYHSFRSAMSKNFSGSQSDECIKLRYKMFVSGP